VHELIGPVTDILLPVLAGGATGVAGGAVGAAGEDFYQKARSLIVRMGLPDTIGDRPVSAEEVARSLEQALSEGTVAVVVDSGWPVTNVLPGPASAFALSQGDQTSERTDSCTHRRDLKWLKNESLLPGSSSRL
jgi:hypothetical protein